MRLRKWRRLPQMRLPQTRWPRTRWRWARWLWHPLARQTVIACQSPTRRAGGIILAHPPQSPQKSRWGLLLDHSHGIYQFAPYKVACYNGQDWAPCACKTSQDWSRSLCPHLTRQRATRVNLALVLLEPYNMPRRRTICSYKRPFVIYNRRDQSRVPHDPWDLSRSSYLPQRVSAESNGPARSWSLVLVCRSAPWQRETKLMSSCLLKFWDSAAHIEIFLYISMGKVGLVYCTAYKIGLALCFLACRGVPRQRATRVNLQLSLSNWWYAVTEIKIFLYAAAQCTTDKMDLVRYTA